MEDGELKKTRKLRTYWKWRTLSEIKTLARLGHVETMLDGRTPKKSTHVLGKRTTEKELDSRCWEGLISDWCEESEGKDSVQT